MAKKTGIEMNGEMEYSVALRELNPNFYSVCVALNCVFPSR